MIPRFKVVTALVAAASCIFSVNAISKVSRTGRYLYTDDGNRFYIKGVAYQEQGVVVEDPNNPFGEPSSFFDPLADADACARDIPHLRD
ncbi:hypothetical protein MPER_07195 [Moniliophthora perniciosa FA553]|nr:hypothetical protein MPER_07195 [Moniliophthora perniciosa FA553]